MRPEMFKGKKRGWWLGLGLIALLVLGGVLLVSLLEWRPAPLEDTPIHAGQGKDASPVRKLSLLSFNLGYAGLGRDADFFMDGGQQVRPPNREIVESNLKALIDWLSDNQVDVMLLQEVDSPSRRTHGVDQMQAVTQALPAYHWARALNFRVAWIPYPLLEPIGGVQSGLLTLSRQRPTVARRHQLPGMYPWPVRMFHLKRCLHEIRLPAADGKDWVVFHLHLSAFDKGGALRQQQLAYLKRRMLAEYAAGHHVVVGGDWNHAPPGLADDAFVHAGRIPPWFQRIPQDWTPANWTWAADFRVASLRSTDQPYRQGNNFRTVVDAFLLSPDIDLRSVTTVDLGFTHSDHQPVRLEIALRE